MESTPFLTIMGLSCVQQVHMMAGMHRWRNDKQIGKRTLADYIAQIVKRRVLTPQRAHIHIIIRT